MPAPRYLTTSGEVVRRCETSDHHVFWEDKWYTTKNERTFINMGGLVLRLVNTAHNYGTNGLHPNVPPPPKPSQAFMQQITEFAHDIYEQDDYDAFYKIAHFIGDVANSSWSAERADEAFRIHENLMQQAKYVEIGKVTPAYARV